MRARLALALIAAIGVQPVAALETARELAASGAARLALARVEQLQPRDSGTPRWGEWEALRIDLLVRLRRYEDALRRAAALPAGMPPAVLRQCLLEAARAAVAAGQGEPARAYAARLLWRLEATPVEARAARLLVIDSYVADRKGGTAYRAMLRYQQDYRPLENTVAERFVEALLELGQDKEAVNWLSSLDEASPLKVRLQVRAGLVAPEAAVRQTRERLARGGGAGHGQVLADAAAMLKSGALRIEALERLIHDGGGNAARSQALAAELWQTYTTEAKAAANRNNLLAGDDNAWLDLAARRLGADPVQSRALFAYLSRNSSAQDVRMGAQLQLVFSLHQSGLDHAALMLFSEERAGTGATDPQARYLLGTIAEARNAPALAARFWKGLAAPPDGGAEEWQVRIATAQWRAGMVEAAAATMRALMKGGKPLPGPASSRALVLAREMRDTGTPELAQEMLAALLPLAGREHARNILYALGGIAESAAQHARAADFYLRSALADDARAADPQALQARLAAGINLARAGYKDDARAQFQWLIQHARDPAQRESARRELSKL